MKKKENTWMSGCKLQRVFDILLASTALILLSPILLVTMLALRFTGEGEVFFKQKRVGHLGKNFYLLKFATMLKDSPNIATGTITIKDDPRILPFGKFLRSSKINELPQLFNVLFGTMSLIGPRPLTEETFGSYPHTVQHSIKLVTPGLQHFIVCVIKKNASKIYETEIAPFKGELEMWYAKNRTLYTYFALIFLTIFVVVTGKSKIAWQIFRDLPYPTDFLLSKL